MWAFVAIAGILWLAYSTYLDHQQKLARIAGSAPDGDLRRELDAARAERDALRTRIEALEAIVTDDGFDLEREARRAGIEPRLDLDALPDAESDERLGAERRRVR